VTKKIKAKREKGKAQEVDRSDVKVYRYNQLVKGAFILLLLAVMMSVLVLFLQMLNVEKPVLLKWMMYSALLVCGVPLWANTKSYTKFKKDHEKINHEIAIIEQKLGRNKKAA